MPDDERVGADVDHRGRRAVHDEDDEQRDQTREHGNEEKRGSNERHKRGVHPVAVETVEESATRERADDVAEGLRGEEHADLADTRPGSVAELGERWAEQGK